MRAGGAGAGAGGGGAGGPAMSLPDFDPASLSPPPERGARQVRPGDEGDGRGGSGHAPAERTTDSDGLVSFNGLEFFVDLESGHIPGTQHSVNQLWKCAVYDQESQVESNMDWQLTKEDEHMEENTDSDCEDGVEGESNNYDDFLVRCEGDTDVEDCFPTQIQEAVVGEIRSMEEMQNEGSVKDAKYKAHMTREAKRRAIEGVVKDQSTFSDQDSDDCKELIDSSDDDHAVDGNDLSKTKRKSKATKLVKRSYYDESRLNKDY